MLFSPFWSWACGEKELSKQWDCWQIIVLAWLDRHTATNPRETHPGKYYCARLDWMSVFARRENRIGVSGEQEFTFGWRSERQEKPCQHTSVKRFRKLKHSSSKTLRILNLPLLWDPRWCREREKCVQSLLKWDGCDGFNFCAAEKRGFPFHISLPHFPLRTPPISSRSH